jgi:hypothetical protein
MYFLVRCVDNLCEFLAQLPKVLSNFTWCIFNLHITCHYISETRHRINSHDPFVHVLRVKNYICAQEHFSPYIESSHTPILAVLLNVHVDFP